MTTRKLVQADKVVKRVRFFVRTFITVFLFVFLIFALISMVITIMLLKSWASGHAISLRSPIQFQNPIIVEEIELKPLSEIKPLKVPVKIPEENKTAGESGQTKSEKDIVMEQKDGKLLWAMYQLETQRGKTDFCRVNGKGFGGWGVKDRGSIVCYETFEKAVARAQYWLTKNKENSTLAQTLCRWSGHGNVNDCTYYRNAVSQL